MSLQDLLHHSHAIECPVKCIQGRLYVRISAAIYNTLQDYVRLQEAVLQIAHGPELSLLLSASSH